MEAIREGEASPGQGLHVNEIAKFSVIDPKKLCEFGLLLAPEPGTLIILALTENIARVLRLLASQHFFREVSLDTFTNTRTTIAFDTGKAANDLKKLVAFALFSRAPQLLRLHPIVQRAFTRTPLVLLLCSLTRQKTLGKAPYTSLTRFLILRPHTRTLPLNAPTRPRLKLTCRASSIWVRYFL